MQRDTVANNLFFFAEIIAAEALFQGIGIPFGRPAIEKLVSELFDLTMDFLGVFDDLMGIFLEAIGQEAWQTPAQPVVLGDLPSFDDIHIPWFTDTSIRPPSPG